MDDLVSTLTGQPASQDSAIGTYGTPAKILDNLKQTESSGNPYAVNKDTGAMGAYQFMPGTVAALHKQGIQFNPFDEKQSRDAADQYIQTLKAQHGDYSKALAAYGGFVTKDPSAYVGKVLNGTDAAPAQPAQAPAQQPIQDADSFNVATLTGGAPSQSAAPTPSVAGPDIPVPMPSITITGKRPAQPEPSFMDRLIGSGETALSVGTGLIAPIPGAIAAAGNMLTNGKFGTQEGVREAGDAYSKGADAVTYNPRTETGKNYLAELGNTLNDSGLTALAPIAELHALGSSPIGAGVKNQLTAALTDAKATVKAGGNPLMPKAPVSPAALQTRVEPTMTASAPAAANPAAAASDARPLVGVGAASSNLNPYPALSGEETARGSLFPQVKTSKIAGDVPAAEQATRAQIANEILGPDHGAVRPGVVTGNIETLKSEHTHAKSPEQTPVQQALAAQIAKEQDALSNYAQQRVEATGARSTLTNNEQRGQVINDAFHGEGGLQDFFQQAKQQIYDQAKAESGGNPIQTGHIDALLNDPQFLAEAERNGHTGVVSGVQKLIGLARDTGFKDPITGEVHAPGSVGAWDAVRKSNNAGWSPDTARTISAINQAIDRDVSAAAGSEAYKLGDTIHRAQKTIMDTPAIAKVFGGADANGIKDGVALEKLPSKLNNMPMDQWRHIHDTLDDLSRGQVRGAPEGMPPVPAELRQMAGAARDEMRGALAREVYEQGAGKAGVWNQNSANKVLNSVVGQKIAETFAPDEVQRFHALNYGGQIMPGVHSYEGAALQAQRLSKPGFVERNAERAGATVGGLVTGGAGAGLSGGIAGAAGAGYGATLGKMAGNKLASGAKATRLQSEANQLLEAMRANSALGKN